MVATKLFRRKILLAPLALGILGIGYSFRGLMLKKNIEDMPDKFSLLEKKTEQRKNEVPEKPLAIESAEFLDTHIDGATWGNIHFYDCTFSSDSFINCISMEDVHFERCDFLGGRLLAKKWKNVTFTKCNGKGEFSLKAEERGENILFEECKFAGGAPDPQDLYRTDNFGSISIVGDAEFRNCELQYVVLSASKKMTIKECKTHSVNAAVQRGNGELYVERVKGRGYLDFGACIFSRALIKDCEVDEFIMSKTYVSSLVLDGCSMPFFAKFAKFQNAVVRNSIFYSDGNPDHLPDRRYAGFSVMIANIKNLEIDNVQFKGTNGSLFLGGEKNLLFGIDKKDKQEPINFSKYDHIFIKNTSLKRGYLSYVKANRIVIDGCDISDAEFSQSEIDTLVLKNLKMDAKVNFSKTVVKILESENVIRAPNLKLVKDEASVAL